MYDLQDRTKLRLGEALVQLKIISNDQLIFALQKQKELGNKRLGQILVDEGIITQKQLIGVLETQFGVQAIDLKTVSLDSNTVKKIPESFSRKHNIIPVKEEGNKLYVAMSDPLDRPTIMDVTMLTKKIVEPMLASVGDIAYALDRTYKQAHASQAAADYITSQSNTLENIDSDDLDIDSTPIVRLVASIIETGVRNGASDIHIEPEQKSMRVRMRIDGLLREMMATSNKPHNALVSRIKIMAELNISEKRLPQDGRVLTKVDNKDIDLRVATMPSTQGEKIVIRILDRSSLVEGIENLGLTGQNVERFRGVINRPHGMVFVTGPTGSGKTTTLYTVLSSLKNSEKNILTIEDPVEFDLEGINQTQVNSKAGLTFAVGLRGFMRADPDIIMVGEVRDEETADVAVQSALTGHLMLSTLHTNDSVGAVARMIEMGIKPYILASSLSGAIAQRLVRKICPFCKTSYKATTEEKAALGVTGDTILYKGAGCERCSGTGYKGRLGIFEILKASDAIKELIIKDAPASRLLEVAKQEGMTTLREDGIEKVLNGITTVSELIRVT